MAYIVRGPEYGSFSTQSIVGDGVEDTFSLNWSAPSSSALLVVVGGVVQEPMAAYNTASGGYQIVFSEPIPNGVPGHITFLGRSLTVPVAVGSETVSNSFTGDGSTLQFTMSSAPVVSAGVLVFVDGVMQSVGPGKNCTVAGAIVSFSTAPVLGAEIDTYVLARERIAVDVPADYTISRNKLANDIRGQVGSWAVVSGNTNCSVGTHYFVDTLGAARTMTLPAVATLGDRMEFVDYSGTFNTNNCVINRNGHLINGLSEDLILDVNGGSVELIYSGVTFGWRIKS